MVRSSFFVSFFLVSAVAVGDNHVRLNQQTAGLRGGQQYVGRAAAEGAQRPPNPLGNLSESQRQAFGACLQQAGVALPTPPALSAEQKAVLDGCRASSEAQGPQAVMQCAQAQGVNPPTPPKPSQRELEAFRTCQQKVSAR